MTKAEEDEHNHELRHQDLDDHAFQLMTKLLTYSVNHNLCFRCLSFLVASKLIASMLYRDDLVLIEDGEQLLAEDEVQDFAGELMTRGINEGFALAKSMAQSVH